MHPAPSRPLPLTLPGSVLWSKPHLLDAGQLSRDNHCKVDLKNIFMGDLHPEEKYTASLLILYSRIHLLTIFMYRVLSPKQQRAISGI